MLVFTMILALFPGIGDPKSIYTNSRFTACVRPASMHIVGGINALIPPTICILAGRTHAVNREFVYIDFGSPIPGKSAKIIVKTSI